MKEGKFFPLFINLEGKKCLVVGAGKIAYRKAVTLLGVGASITVIGKEIAEEKFFNLGNIELFQREFQKEDLEDKFLVCAATDNKELNLEIVKRCEEKNILVNNMTSKTEMNCRFAATIEKEDCHIGISAKGNPKKALELKEKILTALDKK